MASLTMPASLLGCSAAATATRTPPTTGRRGSLVVAKSAVRVPEPNQSGQSNTKKAENRSSTYRRDLVFAGVVATAYSLAKMAMADEPKTEEPKRGTPEARKKYAPVCVSMPTASICHK